MTYTKPELNTLGDAASVIQSGKFVNGSIDPADNKFDLHPVYDLDE